MGTVGVLLLGTAACSGGDSSAGASSGACTPAKPGTKVTLSFSSWVPGMDKTVALWNKTHPDIHVNYHQVVGGQAGTYQAYSNQIKAGNTGDLGQIEFDALPGFRLQDGLKNIASCPGIKAAAGGYVPWAMKQLSFGEPGAVYGIPQDIGPLALYYRKDLFQKYGIPVPTTWAQFAADAQKVKAHGAFITDLPPDQPAYLTALAWQAGAKWFTQSNGSWTVDMTDPKTEQVADYWQKLLDQKLVDTKPGLGNPQWKALDTGQEWTLVGAAWTAKLLESNAPHTAGKWAVAPMPQWSVGQHASASWGGSVTVVFKDSKHPAEAAEFAAWAFGHLDALALNNKNGGQFPASIAGETKLPALTAPYPYYGNQVIWKVFQQAAAGVNDSWTWGPTMTETYSDLGDGLSAAVNGKGTLADAFKAAQQKTIATMKSQALKVSP